MLNNPNKRKSAKITFDPAEYKQFLADRSAFYTRIEQGLQRNGQTAFRLDYSDLKSLPCLNGLAQFLGIEAQLHSLKDPISRQNPEPLEQKVENSEALTPYLCLPADASGQAPQPESQSANVSQFAAAEATPLIYATLPGGLRTPALRWMRQNFEGVRKFDQEQSLFDWLDKNPGHRCFAILEHPVRRAYSAFMKRIFHTGKGGYPGIRRHLVDYFEMKLPSPEAANLTDPKKLETIGYDHAAHQNAFLVFLNFLRLNLSDQTSVRTDNSWSQQFRHVQEISKLTPLSHTLREDNAIDELTYLASQSSIDQTRPLVFDEDMSLYPLDDILTEDMLSLTREAYAEDFLKFGFNLQPAPRYTKSG
jgi:hypothetical protein